MKEVFEVENADASKTENTEMLSDIFNDKHLPNYNFNGYPLLDDDDPFGSPRINDEVWTAFENQSKQPPGAT